MIVLLGGLSATTSIFGGTLPPGELGPEGQWTCKIQFRGRPSRKKLTIETVIQKALTQNPTLKESRATIGMASGARITAGLTPNPTAISIVSNLNKTVGSQLYQWNQTIETGGKRSKRVRVADCEVTAATLELQNRERLLVNHARTAFIRVLQMLSDAECADRTLHSYDDIRRAESRVKGNDSESQLRISNERLDLELEQERAVLGVEDVKHDLAEIVAEPALWDQYDVEGGMQYVPANLNLERLRNAAFADRPDWKGVSVLVEQAQARLRLARSMRIWNVNVGPVVSHVDGDSQLGVGFLMSTQPQIFDRNQGEIAKEKANIERVSENRRRMGLNIERELRKTFDHYRVIQKIVQSYRERYLKNSVLALNNSTKALQEKKISATDYLDALRTYRKIQIGYRRALAEYMLSLSDVNLTCGSEIVPLDGALSLGKDSSGSLYFSPTYLSSER